MASGWISKGLRAAIYQRDSFRCVYCDAAAHSLSLDHVKARSTGGELRDPRNLVTACVSCNASKGARPTASFVRLTAERTGQSPDQISRRVAAARRRSVPGYILVEA